MSFPAAGSGRRSLRVFHFCPWAERLEDAAAFLQRLPSVDLRQRIADTNDEGLLRMARLDCDWHGENTRAFAGMAHDAIGFLPAKVFGPAGLLDLAQAERPSNEEWWLVFDGQNPQKIAAALGKLLPFLIRKGMRVLYYAFDEASRTMPCFGELAPFLSILIHDEAPLDPRNHAKVSPECTCIHRSWVANLLPYAAPFNDAPEEKILFLGSKLGLTPHRQRQIDYLGKRFGQRFTAIHDHSVGVAERTTLNRFKVSVCPEGRKFSTPAMQATHTDRPFWSGCLGMVPVSENSLSGGRLGALAGAGLILRYPHGDLERLGDACEQALSLPTEKRRLLYDHFNREETVGTVVAGALAEVQPGR